MSELYPDFLEMVFDKSIAMKVYMKLPSDVVADNTSYMCFKHGSRTYIFYTNELSPVMYNNDTYYVFICPLVSKCMIDPVTFWMVSDDKISDTWTFSVKDYAEYIIAANNDEHLVAIMKAFLNYAAAIQVLFSYSADNLINANLSDEDKNACNSVTLEMFQPYIAKQHSTINGVNFARATLNLDKVMQCQIEWQIDETHNLGQFAWRFNQNDYCSLTPHSGNYRLIKEFSLQNADQDFQIYCNNQLLITMSPLSVIRTYMKSSEEKYYYFAQTFYVLYKALKEYRNQ